jgi:hypothetical protein
VPVEWLRTVLQWVATLHPINVLVSAPLRTALGNPVSPERHQVITRFL